MSIFKPRREVARRELIENALKDLDPSIREQARRILETLDDKTLSDRNKVREILKKHKLI